MKLLFLCGRNRRRSPTAEQIFGGLPGLQVLSAGLSPESACQVDAEMLDWADLVLVMERSHQQRLTRMFGSALANKRVVCLGILDDYGFLDEELVRLLRQRSARHVPGIAAASRMTD